MRYTKRVWKDRNVQYPNRYTDELSNVKTFTPAPGTITEAGDYVTAAKMNNLENGVNWCSNELFDITSTSLTYTGTNLTQVDELISGTLYKRTVLTYTGSQLTSTNVKHYDTDGITIVYQYNETLTYSGSTLTAVTRTVI